MVTVSYYYGEPDNASWGIYYFLRVWVTLRALFFIVALPLVWKYRNQYPFKGRVVQITALWYGLLFLQTMFATVDYYVSFDSPVRVSGAYHAFYIAFWDVAVPLVCFCCSFRAVILLYRGRIQQTLVQIEEYQRSKVLPPGIDSIETLRNNYYIRNRHHISTQFISKFLIACIIISIVTAVPFFVVSLLDGSVNTLVSTATPAGIFVVGSAMIYLGGGFVAGLHLRGSVPDNLGILFELQLLCGFCVSTITVRTILSIFFPVFAEHYQTEWVIHSINYSYASFVSIGLQLMKVNYKTTQTSRTASTLSNTASTSYAPDNVTVFLSEECTNLSFAGVLASCEGYAVFLQFCLAEFASENLMYWISVRHLMVGIQAARNPPVRNERAASTSFARNISKPIRRVTAPAIHRVQSPAMAAYVTGNSSQQGNSANNTPSPSVQQSLVLPGAMSWSEADTARAQQETKQQQQPPLSPGVQSPQPQSPMSRPSPAAQSVTGAVAEQGDTGITADGPEKNTHLLTSESPFWSQLESLYELYLSPTGLSQVNLSAPSMQGAQSAIVELKALMEAKPQYKTLSSISTPVDIEAGAEFLDMIKDSGLAASAREILHLMKMDTWTRFQHSKPFKKLRATVKARAGKTSPEQQCITIHPDPAKSK